VATSERVPPEPAVADNLPTSGRPGTWAVQVIATRDRAIAGSILKRLTSKGYPAFLVNPSANATPAYYKVHVGRYNDRGEAEKVSLRIKKEEQFQSWITR
jgi:cell division septation protein DedD